MNNGFIRVRKKWETRFWRKSAATATSLDTYDRCQMFLVKNLGKLIIKLDFFEISRLKSTGMIYGTGRNLLRSSASVFSSG